MDASEVEMVNIAEAYIDWFFLEKTVS